MRREIGSIIPAIWRVKNEDARSMKRIVVLCLVPVRMCFPRTFFSQGPHTIIKRSQGADPAAEYPSQNNGHQDEDKGEKKRTGDILRVGCQRGCQENERVEVKKKPDRITERVVSLRFRLDKEEKEQEEEKAL